MLQFDIILHMCKHNDLLTIAMIRQFTNNLHKSFIHTGWQSQTVHEYCGFLQMGQLWEKEITYPYSEKQHF